MSAGTWQAWIDAEGVRAHRVEGWQSSCGVAVGWEPWPAGDDVPRCQGCVVAEQRPLSPGPFPHQVEEGEQRVPPAPVLETPRARGAVRTAAPLPEQRQRNARNPGEDELAAARARFLARGGEVRRLPTFERAPGPRRVHLMADGHGRRR